MKKIIYLFIALITLQSCSDSDDSTLIDPISIDPIIGTWKLTSDIINGSEEADDCSRNSTLVFSEDGSYFSNFYEQINEDTCEISQTVQGTWNNNGDSIYTFDYTDDSGDYIDTIEIVFSEDNTVFTFTETEIYNDETDTYVTVFSKQ